MNIINNAKDAISLSKNNTKLIFVNIYEKDNNAIISIYDNAGGIENSIIDKIFEPYFTTKHKAQGTGIGLYMSNEIITKHMNGQIIVYNKEFIYENILYKGALFEITIPIKE
jgi:signal transduction histidine kinase